MALDSDRRWPVLVGVDGSASSDIALDLAVDEAVRRRLPLRIVHAVGLPFLGQIPGPARITGPHGQLLEIAEQMTDGAIRRAAKLAPGVEVSQRVAVAQPARFLLDEAWQAELVVLGSRGLGGFPGLVIGSVSSQVATHAVCPVIVVPPESGRPAAEPAGPMRVVAGADGSPVSEAAIAFAFEEASLRQAELIAVRAVDTPALRVLAGSPAPTDLATVADEQRALTDSLEGWRAKYPNVAVTEQVVQAYPSSALLAAARPDDLIVVGSRGRGGFRGLLLGSVSLAVLHHATSPVAVVRPAH